jgi:hypothetical protein
LLYKYQCAAHPRNTTDLKNIEACFSPPTGYGYHPCLQKQLIWKAVTLIDGELLGDEFQNEDQLPHSSSLHRKSLETDNTNHHRELLQEVCFFIRR